MKKTILFVAGGFLLGFAAGYGYSSHRKEVAYYYGELPMTKRTVVSVPVLHGDDVIIPVEEVDKITPLQWAMMLDRDKGTSKQAFTESLYDRAVLDNPELGEKVIHLLEVHAMIQSRKRELGPGLFRPYRRHR